MQLLGYPLIITLTERFGKPKGNKDYSFQPFISLIVPTYNEESSISTRINNLLNQHYPDDKFEIIIVDSGSTDRTVLIGRVFEKKYSNIRLIEEGRRNGKASAINLGKSYANGDIILVTDANATFNDDALKEIVPHFKNSEVGAVGGRFVLTNDNNRLVAASSFYWDIESLMRRGESNFDSACTFHGEINAWRKAIVKADIQALAEDLEMAVQIRKKGYKIVYEPKAIAYEAGPTTNKEQIIQKKRTTIGTIQCLFKHKRYLWFPHDKYSGVIFPFHKMLQILSPLLLLGILVLLVSLLFMQEIYIASGFILASIIVFSISYLILNSMLTGIRTPHNDRKKSISIRSLYRIIYYVLLHELIILTAWKDFLSRQYSVKWQKAETTRS